LTLFFYGIVELRQDSDEVARLLAQLGQKRGWQLRIGELEKEIHSFSDVFNLPDSRQAEFLSFEVSPDDDIYAGYSGDKAEQHYRQVARIVGLPNWETIEFGSNEIVDHAYLFRIGDVPVIHFMESLFETFPNRQMVINFDQDFDNRFGCKEVMGGRTELLVEAWRTIAFGYSWPNLRLKLTPP
jgi:hypothetical protein